MMVRKLAAALLGVGVFIPGLANALGLGEIKLNSALSEPLDAEIELVQVRELTATEILPSLATQEDFAAAGVERYQFLGDLKFEVVVGDKGKSYIKVRSRKPIKEPFLNFLVEVNWPAGRLLREYTMLLDPPIYSEQKSQPVQPAKTAAAPKRVATPSSKPRAGTPTTASEQTSGTAAGADSHTITSNDSLWSIAKNLKPSESVTVQQTMIALQRYNPDAFIDSNINLLRRGEVLRAPSESQAMEVSSRDAIEMVAQQNRLWQERIASRKSGTMPEAPQMDLTGRTADQPAPTTRSNDEGRLKLLAGSGTGDTGQGGAGTQPTGELRNKLAQAEESIDKFKLENDDLKVKMSDLEDQLKTSEKVLSLKDQQIAALQAKLADLDRQSKQAATAEPEAAPVKEEVAPETAQVEEPDVEPVSPEVDFNYEEEAPAAEQASAPEATVDTSEPEQTAETTAAQVEQDHAEPVAQQPVVEPESAPEQAPVVAEKPDLITELTSNPLYLAIAGSAVVLLLAAALMIARRKKQAEEDGETIDDDFQLPDNNASLQDDMEIDLDQPAQDFMETAQDAPREETVQQTSDVLGEADIYIAYGRYPQAIEMLQKAADKEPERADIRMKLCEVCADAKDPEGFMKHYRVLQTLGVPALLAKATELKARVAPQVDAEPVMDEVPMADEFDAAFSEEALSEPMTAADSFDFDINDEANDAAVTSSALDQESDTGLDFDLGDLEDTGASFAEKAPQTTPVQQDSGMDFDFNMESAEAAPIQDDGGLDFDLDMDIAPTIQPETAADNGSLDFDAEFSLDEVDNTAVTAGTGIDEDLSLDFDQMETGSSEPVLDASNQDFDLDFDIETAPLTEISEAPAEIPTVEAEQALAFTPAADEKTGDDSLLDSAAAAQLADELDFDVSFDTASPSEEVAAPPAQEISRVTTRPMQPAANDYSHSAEDELDFLSDADETSTKLDLARAYIDMGDRDGARDILDEVMIEGSDNQRQEAKDLLLRLEA